MEYYRPPVPQPEKKDRTLIGVLLTGCGCLTIIGILFVIGAGKFFGAVRGPGRIVRSQLEAISIGNYQLAYSYFSSDFRKNHSLQEFRNDLQEFLILFPLRKIELNQTNIVNDRAVVDGTIVGKDGAIVPIHYELVKEKAQWRIQTYHWTSPGHLEKV
jgi:Domain of unknown function (DUF4864)